MTARQRWSLTVGFLGVLIAHIHGLMGVFLSDALLEQPAGVQQTGSPAPWFWRTMAACAVLATSGFVFAVVPARRWSNVANTALGAFVTYHVVVLGVSLTVAVDGLPADVRRVDDPDPELWVAMAACAVLVVSQSVLACLPDDARRRAPSEDPHS